MTTKTYNQKLTTADTFEFQLMVDGKAKKFTMPRMQHLTPKLNREYLALNDKLKLSADGERNTEQIFAVLDFQSSVFAQYMGITADEFEALFQSSEQMTNLIQDWMTADGNTVALGE